MFTHYTLGNLSEFQICILEKAFFGKFRRFYSNITKKQKLFLGKSSCWALSFRWAKKYIYSGIHWQQKLKIFSEQCKFFLTAPRSRYLPFLRSNRMVTLQVPFIKCCHLVVSRQCAFLIATPALWYTLPPAIWQAPTLLAF